MTGNIKLKNKFGMLLKHDFLASARVISFFYIVEAFCLLLFFIGNYLMKNSTDPGKIALRLIQICPIAAIVSFLVAMLLIFLTIFYIIFDFNKSLYSPQGYLSFTLPVSSHELLLSKTLIYGGWMIVSFLVFYFVTEQMAIFTSDVLDETYGEGNVETVTSVISSMFNLPSLSQIIASAIFMMLNIFTVMFTFVATAYFAISVAHMRYFQKYSLFWSVLIFFPVFFILLWLALKPADYLQLIVQFKADGGFGFGVAKPGETYLGGYDISRIIMSIAECVGLFFATSYIMHKKVNIK